MAARIVRVTTSGCETAIAWDASATTVVPSEPARSAKNAIAAAGMFLFPGRAKGRVRPAADLPRTFEYDGSSYDERASVDTGRCGRRGPAGGRMPRRPQRAALEVEGQRIQVNESYRLNCIAAVEELVSHL